MSTTPAEVVRTVAAGVSRLAVGGLTPADRETLLDHLADLYAEDTDVRHPFAPPGSMGSAPLRTRAELREHFASADGVLTNVVRWDPVDTVVHTTGDPEVVVVELAYAAATPDREFRVPMILVVRVRDGRIVESRDYSDHAAMARGFAGDAAA